VTKKRTRGEELDETLKTVHPVLSSIVDDIDVLVMGVALLGRFRQANCIFWYHQE
jgi:hypothetical protein